jgi:hypothetical protein
MVFGDGGAPKCTWSAWYILKIAVRYPVTFRFRRRGPVDPNGSKDAATSSRPLDAGSHKWVRRGESQARRPPKSPA